MLASFFRAAVFTVPAALSCFSATAATAETAFECSFQQVSVNGPWIPEFVAIALEDDGTEAAVLDPLIKHFIGDPLPAKIETDNTKRTTFVWELKAQSGTNQYVRMKYRMTIQKAGLKASISATPQGFEGNFQAQGSCKKAKA